MLLKENMKSNVNLKRRVFLTEASNQDSQFSIKKSKKVDYQMFADWSPGAGTMTGSSSLSRKSKRSRLGWVGGPPMGGGTGCEGVKYIN